MKVAFIGVKTSGKSLAAESLAELGFKRIALADPVKDASYAAVKAICKELDLPVPLRPAFDAEKAVYRTLLQWVGTDLVRNHLATETYWIERFLARVAALQSDGWSRIICDDCRFANEVDALRAAGFLIVKIVRVGLISTDPHPSEAFAREFEDWDFLIENSGPRDDYQALVRGWAAQMLSEEITADAEF